MTWQALQLGGTAIAHCPDSANLSITDNLDLRLRLLPERWMPTGAGNEQTFISKRQGGDEWTFRTFTTNGRLEFVWWDTGGVATTERADADTPFADGTAGWIRVRRSGTNVNFWTSTDTTNDHTAVSWTALGTTQTTPAGSIRSTVATHVTIGASGNGGNVPYYGLVYAVAVVDNVTTRADPNFTNPAEWTIGERGGDTGSDGVNTWTLGGFTKALIVGDNIPYLPIRVGVQLGLGRNPFDATPSWTDITEDVRTLTFDRGRFYELDRIDTGTASLELENFDGKYNSNNTTSPYYPNIKPNTPVRITAIHNEVVYHLWQGFADRWPVTFPENTNSLVSVSCSDLFKLLAKAKARNEGRIATVQALKPLAWWRFADDQDETGNEHTLTFAGGVTEGAAAGAWTGDIATLFDGANDEATVADELRLERTGDNQSHTWESWLRPSGTGGEFPFAIALASPVPNDGHYLSPQWLGAGWTILGPYSQYGLVLGPFTATVDEWQHLVISDTVGASATLREVYVDGVFQGSIGFANVSVGQPWLIRIGSEGSAAATFWQGEISEIAVYPSALGAASVETLFEASFDAFESERTDERIAYILSDPTLWLGGVVPSQDLDVGATVMTGLSPTDTSALDAIQTAVETERGLGFMTGNGAFRFQNRYYRLLEQDTPVTTFNQTHYDTPVIGHDDDLLFNSIEVFASNVELPAVVEDQTSIDNNGRTTLSVNIYPLDPNEATDAGAYILSRYSETFLRLQTLSFTLEEADTAATIGFLLGAELSNRYNVEVPLAGDDLDVDVFLERIHHTIDLRHVWTVEWQLSAATAEASFWELGVAGKSELGVTTVLAY